MSLASAARAANLAMALSANAFVESQTGMREAVLLRAGAPTQELQDAWARAALRDGRLHTGDLARIGDRATSISSTEIGARFYGRLCATHMPSAA